jgi:hypothetical protein
MKGEHIRISSLVRVEATCADRSQRIGGRNSSLRGRQSSQAVQTGIAEAISLDEAFMINVDGHSVCEVQSTERENVWSSPTPRTDKLQIVDHER